MSFTGYPGDQEITECLRNEIDSTIFELRGDRYNSFVFEGYQRFPPIFQTCADLKCEKKGLMCVMDATTPCISDSKCCQPIPKCVDNRKFESQKICECDEGYSCRYINDIPTCLPSRCDLIECKEGTECILLEGVNIASCFLSIKFEESNPEIDECLYKKCPVNFTCTKGLFSNADCVPDNIDLLGIQFDCSQCPPGWLCTTFGFGNLCIDWQSNSPHDGDLCNNSKCLFGQYCNSTSAQCEYPRCIEGLCAKGMSCIQYQPSTPRVCATTNMVPELNSLPSTILPFLQQQSSKTFGDSL
eukprot:gene5834-7261_t